MPPPPLPAPVERQLRPPPPASEVVETCWRAASGGKRLPCCWRRWLGSGLPPVLYCGLEMLRRLFGRLAEEPPPSKAPPPQAPEPERQAVADELVGSDACSQRG